MNPVFFGTVKKGKVIFNDRDKFDSHLISLEDKNIDIIVRKHRKDRTNPQNRYMWGVCYKLISETTGYTIDEIHDSMRAMFLMDNSGKFPIVRSSTSLTTVEMGEYLSQIKIWASQELNCYIPDPDDVFLENKEVSPEVLAEEDRTRVKMKEISEKHFKGRKPEQLNQSELVKFNKLLWGDDV